ncbi:MAG: hypothetical protein ACERLG_02250 [Sedimentibacter sp.]
MKKISRGITYIITVLLISFSIVFPCFGNSAEPPSILIIVPNAPDNLEVSIESEGSMYEARQIDKSIEKYYTFYSSEMQKSNNYKLIVKNADNSFEIKLDETMENYNNIFTLNLKTHALTKGKLVSRSVFLILTRLILTLVIEAIVFWVFRFKEKKSWLVFLVINLITQGVLNIWLNGFSPMGSYMVLSLIFGEVFVFLAEIMVFLALCNEHGRLRRVLYVLTANIMSLIVGGYLITILPI